MTSLQKVAKQGEYSSTEQFEHTQRVALALSKSDLLPKAYRGNIPNTIIALELAARLCASPFVVMQNLHVIQGNPSWSSPYIIASINSNPRFKDGLKYRVTGDEMNLECVAWAIENGTNEVLEGPAVTMKMAKLEGWLDKAGSKWKTMPALMIRYRAAAFFGRLYTPEIMLGLKTSEEILDVSHDVVVPQQVVKKTKEAKRIELMIGDASTVEELESLVENVGEDQMELFHTKLKALHELR